MTPNHDKQPTHIDINLDEPYSPQDEIINDTKTGLESTIRENPYDKFELHWGDEHYETEHYESEHAKRIRLHNEDINNKLNILFKKYDDLKKVFDKTIARYPDKINIIKHFYIYVGVIKESQLYSRNDIVNTIINCLETEDLTGYTKKMNILMGNGEGKIGFPPIIFSALSKLHHLFEKLLPELAKELKDHNDNLHIKRDPWSSGGKIR